MIKKEQSWDLMITLNKEDYPVIVKAKPDGGFKVHYISFIVIFHVLVESLAFVDQMYDFAHVFVWWLWPSWSFFGFTILWASSPFRVASEASCKRMRRQAMRDRHSHLLSCAAAT